MFVLPWRNLRFRQLCLIVLSTVTLAAPLRARADGQRVIIISDADVPEELQRGVARALEPVCYISDPGQYLAAARSQRLSPTDEAALTRVGPKAHARMLVVLEHERGKLHVTYRDGKNGAKLDDQTVRARGRKKPKLAARATKAVRAKAQSVLAKLAGQSAPPPSSFDSAEAEDDEEEEDEAQPAAPVKRAPVARTQAAPEPQPRAAAEATPEPEPEAPAEEDSEAAETAESAAAKSGKSEPLSVRIRAGGGVGARVLTVPTRVGPSTIDTGFAGPAIVVGLEAQLMLGQRFILSAAAEYRTLLGARGVQQIGLEIRDSSVGSHSFMFGVAPGYRFGERGSPDLRVFLGYGFRTLSPVDALLPGATTGGFVIRPDLRIPIAGEVLSLRLAPELILALTHDTTLLGNVAGLDGLGIGFGGEVALDIRLSASFLLGVEYRESHVNVGSGWGVGFVDIERCATGRVTLQL